MPDTSAQGAFESFAKRTKGATIRPESPRYEAPPLKVTDEASYNDVKPGTKYIDPEGQERTKAWKVNSPEDYESVPEGQRYLDPDGQERTKPEFKPIDFTAQTLYDMSLTPSEKKKALERSYPGKVFEDSNGLYVEDNGVGGRRYWSDEIGGGVVVWDTALVSDEMLRLALTAEATRGEQVAFVEATDLMLKLRDLANWAEEVAGSESSPGSTEPKTSPNQPKTPQTDQTPTP